jgi:hypothetical protein
MKRMKGDIAIIRPGGGPFTRRGNGNRSLWVILVVVVLAVQPGLYAQDAGNEDAGVRRFGLFVGANDGGSERVQLRYAVSDAARLADVMFRVGGVAPRDAVLLRDPDRQAIESSVSDIAEAMNRARGGARRVEFVFYYSGHSDEEGLLLGDERYRYRDLRDAIESVDADVAVAMLDSCSSGSFTRLKGGRRGQPFLMNNSADMTGYAFLTSSSDDEASQESDEIGASFFTHYLVSGLLGAADTTRDGTVTLNEVYQYAFTETLSRTTRTFAGPQHPSYEIQLTGAGDLVLTDLSQGTHRIVVGSDVSGRVFVREEARGRLVAEFEKYPGETVELAVDPGRYTLELRGVEGMEGAAVAVTAGGVTRIAGSDFSAIRLQHNRLRGGDDDETALGRMRDEAVSAIATVGDVTRGAFTGGDPGSSSFVPADRATLKREPFVLDLLPGIRWIPSDSVPEGESLHHLAVGLLAAESGYTDGVMASFGVNLGTGVTRGIEMSYVGNIRRGRVHGVQTSSVFNIHTGEVRGIQSSSIFNLTDGNVWGVQGAGIFNVVDGEVRGVQGSGVANVAGYAVRGAQLGGVFSMSPRIYGVQSGVVGLAREVRGAQIGVVNIAESVRGAQIGVLNLAEEVDGATLGVLNLVRFGVLDLSFTIDDQGRSWVAFQNGTELLYTIYQFGMRQTDLESDTVEFTSGAGLGTRIWSGTLYLDVDVSAIVQGDGPNGFDYRGPRVFPSLRVSGGIQFGPRFAVLVGARFDGLLEVNDQESAKTHSGESFSVTGDGIEVFPHFFAGVKL